MSIKIKEVSIEEIIKVNDTIIEFEVHYDKNYFEDKYKKQTKLLIIAYLDNKPAGYLIGYDRFNDSSFYCWLAGVSPKFRKKGILKSLMEYEEEWAKKHKYKKIVIKTRNKWRAMISYLVKYGYQFIEVQQKPDISENRIILEKSL